MSALHKSIEERVEGFRSFYRFENSRPLLGFFWGSEYPLFRYAASETLPTNRALVPEDFPVEPYVDDAKRLFEEHEKCGGDFIYAASAFWGIPWLEAIIGCPIVADRRTGSISSRPPETSITPERIADLTPENPWIIKMGEFLEALSEAGRGSFPLGTTRLRGISDLLSALFGPEKMIFQMMENRDLVSGISEKLADGIIELGRFQVERIPEFHGGIGSFYYHVWAPAKSVWLQEDAAAFLSPALCRIFINDHFQRICDSLDGAIVHIHPTGYVPWDALLAAPISLYEMHLDEGGMRARQLLERYDAVRKKAPLLVWGRPSDDDFQVLFRELPPQGLAVMAKVSSFGEAETLWKKWIEGA